MAAGALSTAVCFWMHFGDAASDGCRAFAMELNVDSPGVAEVEKKVGRVDRIHACHLRVLSRDGSMAADEIASEYIPGNLIC